MAPNCILTMYFYYSTDSTFFFNRKDRYFPYVGVIKASHLVIKFFSAFIYPALYLHIANILQISPIHRIFPNHSPISGGLVNFHFLAISCDAIVNIYAGKTVDVLTFPYSKTRSNITLGIIGTCSLVMILCITKIPSVARNPTKYAENLCWRLYITNTVHSDMGTSFSIDPESNTNGTIFETIFLHTIIA